MRGKKKTIKNNCIKDEELGNSINNEYHYINIVKKIPLEYEIHTISIILKLII